MAWQDLNGNETVVGEKVGIGTTAPRSALEITSGPSGSTGPTLTMTNSGGRTNSATLIAFNTFPPPSSGSYNPSSGIVAVDLGNFANRVEFLFNEPGAPCNGVAPAMSVSLDGVAIGNPTTPRSQLEILKPVPGNLGPSITLTNPSGGSGAAASIDFNTFNPTGSAPNTPSARIAAVDLGNNANDIVFESNIPGRPTQGLTETMRVGPYGVQISPGVINTNTPSAALRVTESASSAPINAVDIDVVSFVSVGNAQQSHFLRVRDMQAAPNGLTQFIIRGDGFVGLGTSAPASRLHVEGDITVSGDVLLSGADCAEQFDVCPGNRLEAGTVVVIDDSGALRESTEPYDTRVAGVVSGGGEFRRGLVLDSRTSKSDRAPVALVGKVFCKVDARDASIGVGDLLTTSRTPGHAMKVRDTRKAGGCVIGKALRPIGKGRQGFIPILVSLQ